jgi:hypothetical protein
LRHSGQKRFTGLIENETGELAVSLPRSAWEFFLTAPAISLHTPKHPDEYLRREWEQRKPLPILTKSLPELSDERKTKKYILLSSGGECYAQEIFTGTTKAF